MPPRPAERTHERDRTLPKGTTRTNSIATIFEREETRDVNRKDNKSRRQMTAGVSQVTDVGTLLKTAECMMSAIFHRYFRYMSSHPGLGSTSGNECNYVAVTFFHV